MLVIKSMRKKFGNKVILDDVSLSVPKGHIAVLLGQSGVGKSTLLRILNNLDTLDSGTVELDGKPINLATINKDHVIGMVFQQFNLFEHLTAEENITLALELALNKSPEQAREIADHLLTRYGLADKKDKYPAQLSGGQKQRLALARALALKPKIMCLDEPTSALDPVLTNYVAQNIKELAEEGFTVLIATHDVAIIEKLPCMIYLMKDGKIIESATSTDLAEQREKFPRIKNFMAGAA